MEALALELSKVLNVTVEKAIELMPVIRSQFIRYKILESISSPISVFAFTSLLTLIISGITWFVIWSADVGLGEDMNKTNSVCGKIVKFSGISLIATTVILIGLNILKMVLSPDFMIIKEFILK